MIPIVYAQGCTRVTARPFEKNVTEQHVHYRATRRPYRHGSITQRGVAARKAEDVPPSEEVRVVVGNVG